MPTSPVPALPVRTRNVWVAALLCSAACGPEFAVLPQGGMPQAQVTATGVTMTAFADQWESNPYDLADYLTPIAVDLYNRGPYPVRVALCDFRLLDDRGARYAALNPFQPSIPVGAAEPAAAPSYLVAGPIPPGPGSPHLRLDVRGGWGGGGRGTGLIGSRPGVVVGPPGSRHSFGYHPGYWSGFHVSGGLRGYYGIGPSYLPGPWIYPQGYAEWVFPFGGPYSPAPPTADVVALALPEGVLPPGAHVNGFVYFRRATGGGPRHLDLGWDLYDAQANVAIGQLHVPLDVVRR
jgi:hypothetical protein